MAPAEDSYLPDVARVFAGDTAVFSWEDSLAAICSQKVDVEARALRRLNESSRAKELLSLDLPTFPGPSSRSKSTLESKTAAIHVTPSEKKAYDLDEIKADAQWLSKELMISEEETLRLTLLEWERRPELHLLAGFSETEVASLQDSLGHAVSDHDSNVLSDALVERSDAEFGSEIERRKRLLIFTFREHAALLKLAKHLFEVALLPAKTRADAFAALTELTALVQNAAQRPAAVTSLVEQIEAKTQLAFEGRSWTVEESGYTELWISAQLQDLNTLTEMLILSLRATSDTQPAEVILHWFGIMNKCEYFGTLQPLASLSINLIGALQANVAFASLAILDVVAAVAAIGDSSTSTERSVYCLTPQAASDVHSIISDAGDAQIQQAAPAVLAWAIILHEIRNAATNSKDIRDNESTSKIQDRGSSQDTSHRRTSMGSLNQSIFEDVLDSVTAVSNLQDPVTYTLQCATGPDQAFEILSLLASSIEPRGSLLSTNQSQLIQELVTVAVSAVGYCSDLLQPQFALFSTRWGSCPDSSLPDPRETFIKTDYLLEHIFAVAAARFPYEALPFIRLCRLLASADIFDDCGNQYITYRLRNLDSFTTAAVDSFASYHTVREDENLNLVELIPSANMVRRAQRKLLGYGPDTSSSLVVSSGTVGEVISQITTPAVIRWQHHYHGLALLGVWLELYYLGQLQPILSVSESAEEVTAEIIELLNALLSKTLGHPPGSINDVERVSLQNDLLSDASSNLEHGADIIDYVFDILDQQLQSFRRRPSNTFNTVVLVACLNFAATISEIRPDHFWASMSKSTLLDAYGNDTLLFAGIGRADTALGDSRFLDASCTLLSKAISSLLHRPQSYQTQAHEKPRLRDAYFAARQAAVLLSLTKSAYSIFDNITSWFSAPAKTIHQVVESISGSFHHILRSVYGIGDIRSDLSLPFVSAANFLQAEFCRTNNQDTEISPLLNVMFKLAVPMLSRHETPEMRPPATTLESLISLSHIIARLDRLSGHPVSSHSIQLCNALPLLIRIITVDPSLAATGSEFLADLLDSVSSVRVVSLLGHLGSSTCMSFLDVLNLQRQLPGSVDSAPSIWQLLSRLVRKDQQWLAIVILTGATPERDFKGATHSQQAYTRGKTLMESALDVALQASGSSLQLLAAVLTFIVDAQSNWSWAADALKRSTSLLPAIVSFVTNTYVDPSDGYKMSYRNQIASLVTDICTTQLHQTRGGRDGLTLKTITPLVRWLSENAIEVRGYNASLHANLRKNFATTYPGLGLADFKRTRLVPAHYGDNYYYDLDMANEVLSRKQNWIRTGRYQDQSFSAELKRANLNLSLVESELVMLSSFANICVEHGSNLVRDPTLQGLFVKICHSCLEANTQLYAPDQIFDSLFQSRAEIVLSAMQKLVAVKTRGYECQALLKLAWDCTTLRNASFESAIANDDLDYWRTMLWIILLALDCHVDKRYQPPAADHSPAALLRHTENAIPTVLDVISVVVGEGFKSVSSSIREHRISESSSTDTKNAVVAKDLALVLIIFESILQMARLPEFISEASERLLAAGAIQSCLLLYSWSHTMVDQGAETSPVYAEYGLQFLRALSSLPLVTDELAVEGVLSRLLSARVTQYIQSIPDGAASLDKRPHARFMYNLWATGILPLCLNLLHAVGGRIAAEVSVFLRQFPKQLVRASTAFASVVDSRPDPVGLTLTMATEAATLSLISFVLDSYRNAGASAAVDPSTILPLSGYDEHKKAIADDVVDILGNFSLIQDRIIYTNEREMLLAKMGDGGSSNKLVLRVQTELKNTSICLTGGEPEEDK